MGILSRWVFAFLLVALTYNPTDWNYIRWSLANYDERLSTVVFLGLLLCVGYIIYLRATFRSIGTFGMVLVLSILAALIWMLSDVGILALNDRALNEWLGIFALSVVLGVGLSWSIVRRHLSGQADVDEIDE